MKTEILHDKQKLEELYNNSGSMREVSKTIGCGETAVHKWIHRFFIKPKPRIMNVKGHKKSDSCKKKLSEWAKTRIGEKNANWRNGATPKNMLIRGRQWRERRKLVLARDNYECKKCGSDYNLHIHHIKPVSKFPELVNDYDNLITLCRKCHYELHFPKANLANSVKAQVVNAELSVIDPIFREIGTLTKCVETIHETVRNN